MKKLVLLLLVVQLWGLLHLQVPRLPEVQVSRCRNLSNPVCRHDRSEKMHRYAASGAITRVGREGWGNNARRGGLYHFWDPRVIVYQHREMVGSAHLVPPRFGP